MSRFSIAIAGLVIGAATITYASELVIGQKGRLFSPGTVTIQAGESLVFQNDDAVSHHVYSSTKGQEFDLETVGPGKRMSRTFSKKGRVDVRCGLHPGMRLVVSVE
jgi:plastocyanin